MKNETASNGRQRKRTELRMVVRRRRICATLLDFLRRAESIATSGKRIRGPIVFRTLRSVKTLLTTDRDLFFEAAEACHAEWIAEGRRIEEKDEAAAKVRDGYLDFLHLFRPVCGEEAVRRLGFPDATPGGTEALCRILRRAADAAEDLSWLDAQPTADFVQIDPRPRIRHIRSLVDRVDESRRALAQCRVRLKMRRRDRDEAGVQLDASIEYATHLLKAFLGFHGRARLTKALRRALR